jgi:hypothetical protein
MGLGTAGLGYGLSANIQAFAESAGIMDMTADSSAFDRDWGPIRSDFAEHFRHAETVPLNFARTLRNMGINSGTSVGICADTSTCPW